MMFDKQDHIHSVTVFMSTYNGEKYVEDQIQSIINQKNVNVSVFVRDDGSSDKTRDILQSVTNRNNNIHVCFGENIGYGRSFLSLIYLYKYEKSEYYALSDQDDIWHDDKLISAIKLMKGGNCPKLYYSAQRIVDENGIFLRDDQSLEKVLDYSIWSASKMNLMRGCTEVWNDSFQKVLMDARPNIENVRSHDHFINMIALYKAKIIYDDKPRMDYRQTGENLFGAYKNDITRIDYILKKARAMFCNQKQYKSDISKEIEGLYPELSLATAHYTKSIRDKLMLIFSYKYNMGVSMKWRLFTMCLVMTNRL